MALFGDKKVDLSKSPPADPRWVQGEGGRFPRFLDLDPEAAGLEGRSGVFAIWHTGVHPGWVYVGASSDLARTFYELGEHEGILEYAERGTLHVSWCLIREEFQPGAVAYLTLATKPSVANPDAPSPESVSLVPVYPPGMVPKNDDAKEAAETEKSAAEADKAPATDAAPQPGGEAAAAAEHAEPAAEGEEAIVESPSELGGSPFTPSFLEEEELAEEEDLAEEEEEAPEETAGQETGGEETPPEKPESAV